jgi:phenylalanyl-tRNA synthetase beta subunit
MYYTIWVNTSCFDAASKSTEIIVKTVEAGWEFTTLDDVERPAMREDLMICDEKRSVTCIAEESLEEKLNCK